MPRYKVLKSVARGVADSFTSNLNWGEHDYVMGNVLRRAREVGEGTLRIDLVTGRATPEGLVTAPVAAAAARCAERFRDLVRRHGSAMELVSGACLEVEYDLQRSRPSPFAASSLESPYACRVQITDDRGKPWSAELRGWWCPEDLGGSPIRLSSIEGRKRGSPWWQFWRARRPTRQ